MKKLPKLILPTLIFSAVISQALVLKASALYVDEDGATWYTVQELLDCKEEIDRETDDLCGDDMGCRENLYYSYFETEDYKFWALEQLLDQQVILTALNPKEETLKVLYFDEDMMLRRMGVSEPIDLEVFYMGWFEYNTERIYNFGGITYELFNEIMPGTHKIYSWDTSIDGPNPIPANQEFEITAVGSGLNSNELGEIPYGADAGMYKFNAAGRFIYSSCLTEPDYEEGKECRLMISGEKGQAYFPPRETIIEPPVDNIEENNENREEAPDSTSPAEAPTEPTSPTVSTSTEEQTSAKNPTSIEAPSISPDESTREPAEATDIVTETAYRQQASHIKAPNTGASSTLCIEDYDFPWWLVGMFAFADAIILWIFWPRKSKKSLDKKSEVR